MPVMQRTTGSDLSTIIHRLVDGEIVTEEMQRNLYGVPPAGEYTLEVTGVTDTFQTEYEGQTRDNLRVEFTIRGGKLEGRMIAPMFGATLGPRSHLTKIATAAWGDEIPSGDFELLDLVGGRIKAYCVPSESIDEYTKKPKYVKVSIDTVRGVRPARQALDGKRTIEAINAETGEVERSRTTRTTAGPNRRPPTRAGAQRLPALREAHHGTDRLGAGLRQEGLGRLPALHHRGRRLLLRQADLALAGAVPRTGPLLRIAREAPHRQTGPRRCSRTPPGDAQWILEWWSAYADANVGVATGDASGFFVLDIDTKGGGHDTLINLMGRHGELPETWVVETGSGGLHLFFRMPDGIDVRNSAGAVGPGVDVRGNGGYVVAPPSLHASGRRYRWENHPKETPLADAPDWLLERMGPRRSGAIGRRPMLPRRIPEGERNHWLTSAAGTMRRRGFSPAAIEAALLVENGGRCDPPLDDREVARIAWSVGRYDPAGGVKIGGRWAAPGSPLARGRARIPCGLAV